MLQINHNFQMCGKWFAWVAAMMYVMWTLLYRWYWLIAYPLSERILCSWAIYPIISTPYFVGLILMYVGTSELHFCSLHWYRNISIQKTVSLCKTPLSYVTPMHTLPLFCPTPCMPSPYSVPPHACPAPILSHPMHALPLFCPTPCMPSPYSVPPHACPPPYFIPPMHTLPPILSQAMHTLPPILSQPMHTFPLFYPTPCILSPIPSQLMHTSPYSIPAYAHPPPILFHPINDLPLFYPTVCMSFPVLYQLTHATPVFYSSSCMLS